MLSGLARRRAARAHITGIEDWALAITTGYDTNGRGTLAPPGRIVASETEVAPATSPGFVRPLLERFALIAFALYHLPLFFNNYPSLGGGGFSERGIAVSWGHVFTAPGVWVARHVFHVVGAMPSARNGDNGDTAEEFGRLLLCIVIGAAVAAVWTIVDRRKARAAWVPEALRVLLRYSIALGLASYGIAKILPMQFPPLSAPLLTQRVGDLSPMALLWTFMEYSRPYAFFAGLMECVVVALLCVRRTATLGALVCLTVMTNVALLNFAYGVPVKLYSTMIVISAAVLALYDVPRLKAVFVTNRPAPADESRSPFHEHIATPWRWAIKVALVGSVVLSSVVAMQSATTHDPRRSTAPADSSYRLLRSRFHLMVD
jgi:hypothetical protein